MAAANHKLTKIIAGRTINGTSNQGSQLTINFSDGSHMTVQTTGSSNSASTGGTIDKVRQDADLTTPKLYLDMEGGSSLEIPLASPTSSVMVRAKDNHMEYAD